MQPTQESLKLELFDLIKKRDSLCADCGAASPEWASVSLGIVICVECSGVHRQLGTHLSRVKSVRLDNWKPSEVEDMKKMGNEASNKQFLRLLEPLMSFYPSPKLPEDGSSVREQWIRAKYERKEFCLGLGGMQLQIIQMPIPLLEDWVVKRGAKRKNWKKRWCVVLGTSVAYYAKKGDTQPKGYFNLTSVTGVSIVKEEFEGHHFTIQVDCEDRPFYLALESSPQLFDWVQILRAIKSRLVDGKGGVRKAASASSAELLGRARGELVLRSRKSGKSVVENTFLGSQLIDWLMGVESLCSREDAIAVANEMASMGRFRHASVASSKIVIDAADAYVWI